MFPRDEFERFVRRRQELNERLAASRTELDAWLAEHAASDPPLPAIALLEGLLKKRSDVFQELAKLDDEFVERLLELRSEGTD